MLEEELAALLGAGAITDLRRLSGGASRETWSLVADGRPLILQRQRSKGGGSTNIPMGAEVAVLRAAAAAGVPVPEVVADASDGTALGKPAFVVGRVEGESIARKLLRDDEFAAVRPTLARACGRILAGIHRAEPGGIDGLRRTDQVGSMREILDALGEAHPAFELAFRWLEANRPAEGDAVLVHGDFRTGNLLVTPDGVSAVLDWELAHLGDGLEDLGWFCVRAWRFGEDAKPAGGFGSREELWAGYEEGGGPAVDPAAARWWEVFGTLKWGIICMMQASSHLLGLSRSVELAAIERRTAENEHDLLALLAGPGVEAPPSTPVPEAAPANAPHDRPTVAELVEAVREWIAGDVSDATDGRVNFHARVAVNALAMVERELRMGGAQAAAHADRLAALGFTDDAALAAAIRSGALDARLDEVRTAVWASVRDKLAVAHPGYDQGRP